MFPPELPERTDHSPLGDWLRQRWKAPVYRLMDSTALACYEALRAMSVQPGDYFLLSPFAHRELLLALQSLGGIPIFFDLHEDSRQLDLDLLENFLSLSTIVNERDELIYRKDEAPIRGILLEHHAGGFTDLGTFVFTAQRYHLAILEDFTFSLGLSNEEGQYAGTFGDLSIASLPDGLPGKRAGALVLINPPRPRLGLGTAQTPEPAEVFLRNRPETQAGTLDLDLHQALDQLPSLWQESRENTRRIKQLMNHYPSLEPWFPDGSLFPYFISEKGADLRQHLEGQGLLHAPDSIEDRQLILTKNTYLKPHRVAERFLRDGLAFPSRQLPPDYLAELKTALDAFFAK